jgi:uncharacterized protein with FMN-binding domain
MAGLARRLAPAAALGGLAVVIVGVADPAIAGRTDATETGTASVAVAAEPETTTQAAPDTSADTTTEAPAETTTEAPADTTTEAPAETTTEAATCASGEEVTGESVMTRWGPVQVVATVDGQQVCEVHAVAWPDSDRKSQAINAYAIPELDAMASEVGTSFDYISGATYTSEAYRDSLQSIVDAL